MDIKATSEEINLAFATRDVSRLTELARSSLAELAAAQERIASMTAELQSATRALAGLQG